MGGLVLVLAVVAAARFTAGHDLTSGALLREWFDPLGRWALPAFVLVYAAGTALAVPGMLLTVAGVVLFGAWWGFVAALAGATLGACLAFALARALGRRPLVRRLGHLERWRWLDAALERYGALAVLLLRLLPVLPFNVLNFACGLTSVRFPAFALATFAGMMPATLAFCYATSVLAAPGTGWSSPRAFAALGLLALVVVALPLAWRWLDRRSGPSLLERLAKRIEDGR